MIADKAKTNGYAQHVSMPTRRLLTVSLLLTLALAALYLGKFLFFGPADYVGDDNDDVMRLVIVRDFLAGQGWFDHMQYRLGPEPGTLMHWSRLIDLPIALLIAGASQFTASAQNAEAVALFIWPTLLLFGYIFFAAQAGNRLGGRITAIIAAFFSLSHAFSSGRFGLGAIDHHNVQMLLIAALVAGILDPKRGWKSGLQAGLAAAIALAIGAETTPLLAVSAAAIALRWALKGDVAANFTVAFAMSFAAFSLLIFVVTIPPALYFFTACDAFSYGYLLLAGLGGIGLSLAVWIARRKTTMLRFLALAALSAAAGLTALLAMPQCLASPYANLDPLLVDLWLENVIEARSFINQLSVEPSVIGGHYAAGLLAILVCLYRIWRDEKREAHIMLGLMVAAAWAVTLVQLRGSQFSNLLSVFPLAYAISDLRDATRRQNAGHLISIAFVLLALLSLPAFWFAAGAAILPPSSSDTEETANADDAEICTSAENFSALNALKPGTFAAHSNYGASILRFTQHRALSAPYHRNQNGMLAVLKAEMETPEQARKRLRQAGANYLLRCDSWQKVHAEDDAKNLSDILARGGKAEGFRELKGNWGRKMHVYSIAGSEQNL